MLKKLKYFITNDHNFYALLLVLVAFTSFGLGRRSIDTPTTTQPAGVIYVKNKPENKPEIDKVSNITPTENAVTEKVVASKSGTKYHLLTCPGAKQIKEENKIYFDSPTLAEAGGYQRASNCPDL